MGFTLKALQYFQVFNASISAIGILDKSYQKFTGICRELEVERQKVIFFVRKSRES